MKGALGQLMQQAQEMQEKMQETQTQLANEQVTGEAGGGMVKVTISGQREVLGINIEDQLLGDDKEMLEDLIVAALNDGLRKVETMSQERLAELGGGLSLPPGFNLNLG
ncbi:MAG: YbaB/EbfC family nucleoid-associated protein [Gammaproteobacteria bacterium]|nr:YbaB/EbfC family nucleoid-associated protein [Gammaproteobacteria bacterium]